MTINLTKGGSINLSKSNPGLTKVKVGLGWDVSGNSIPYDLDVSAAVLKLVNGATKLVSEGHFVFYNQKVSSDGSVIHSGDNRTGNGDGDDETIIVDLTKLPAETAEVTFVVTIHEAAQRGQHFGQISNAYANLYDANTGAVLATYDLDADANGMYAIQFVSLYKDASGEWTFKAIGAGYQVDLGAFLAEWQ